MNDELFRKYLDDIGSAASTISTKIASLRRVEREEEIDLDAEYEKDRLESLIAKFQYSMDDFRTGIPNPTKIRIEGEKLYRDLAFYRSVLGSYLRFKASTGTESELSPVETAEQIITEELSQTFALERDMQAAIRANLSQIGSDLKVADSGSEMSVEAGEIDILARDGSGSYVVIELKAGTCRAPAVAQVLAYMGSVHEQYGADVRGILVAADFEKRVQLAAKAVPNLRLKKYSFKFEFSDL